jgi:hypothetical protein
MHIFTMDNVDAIWWLYKARGKCLLEPGLELAYRLKPDEEVGFALKTHPEAVIAYGQVNMIFSGTFKELVNKHGAKHHLATYSSKNSCIKQVIGLYRERYPDLQVDTPFTAIFTNVTRFSSDEAGPKNV